MDDVKLSKIALGQTWLVRFMALLVNVSFSTLASAGTFIGAGESNGVDLVMHPSGYTGPGGELVVNVCIDSGYPHAAEMVLPVQNIVAIFNRLQATTGNYRPNQLSNDTIDFESVAL